MLSFWTKALPGSFSVLCFLPWTLLLSQQQKDNDAYSKSEMFNFSIVPRLSQPRPLPSFCCGGVVREALLSVRVRTGRCPLGTERKNCVQGSTTAVLQWTLEGLATTWLVSPDTRCVSQLQDS